MALLAAPLLFCGCAGYGRLCYQEGRLAAAVELAEQDRREQELRVWTEALRRGNVTEAQFLRFLEGCPWAGGVGR